MLESFDRCIGQPLGLQVQDGRLTGIELVTPDDRTVVQPLDTLLVCLGLSPRLGPIADWGLAMERKQLVVDTAGFETSVPGIHAVGDINTYPGKKKLILCGFHEATLAAFAATRATLVLHLAITRVRELMAEIVGEYGADCPVVVVHRASQPGELVLRGTVGSIADLVEEAGLRQAAVIQVGRALARGGGESYLYDPARDRASKRRG